MALLTSSIGSFPKPRALHEARRERKLVTGLLYINPAIRPYEDELEIGDTPLARLPLETVRPPRAILDEIMERYRRGSVAAAAGGG